MPSPEKLPALAGGVITELEGQPKRLGLLERVRQDGADPNIRLRRGDSSLASSRVASFRPGNTGGAAGREFGRRHPPDVRHPQRAQLAGFERM